MNRRRIENNPDPLGELLLRMQQIHVETDKQGKRIAIIVAAIIIITYAVIKGIVFLTALQ